MSQSRRSRAWWAVKVRAWAESGLSAHEFAGKHELNARSLQWWKWKLSQARTAAEVSEPPERFIEVELSEGGATQGLELVSPRGWTIRVPNGFDTTDLARVMAAMEVPS